MNEIRSHRDLIAWQKAVELGLRVYSLTGSFPDSEKFGLTSQLRRGAISVASNVAEGYGRGATADYLRFLRVRRGAIYELDTQLYFAHQLGYLNAEDYDSVIELRRECGRILAGLIRKIESSAEASRQDPVPDA